MKKITIKEIAREAGVSIATVSNVINKKANKVSEDKKREILEIMKKHNYSPNMNARSLVASHSKMIGFLYYSIHEEIDFGDPFISELMTGVEMEAKKKGNFILFHGFNQLEDIDTIQKNWKFDGFIVVGAFEEMIEELVDRIQVPIVFIDSYYSKTEKLKNREIMFINNNDRELSHSVTAYLLNHGHKQLAFFGPDFSMAIDGVVPQRYLGFLDALNERKMRFSEELVFSENQMDRFVQSASDYTAAVINSDYLAAQYLYAVREQQEQPKSIISFDNNIFSRLLLPPLTTVELKQKKKGELAVDLIDQMLAKAVISNREIVIQGELIERESVTRKQGEA